MVQKKHRKFGVFRTGDERIELPPKVLETPIIPFDQSPIYRKNLTPAAALNFPGTFYSVPSEFHTERGIF